MKAKDRDDVEPLWTPADLARRWGCSVGTVMDRVRAKGVPYLWLGPGEARLAGRGAKLVRFRRKAVEQWESEQEGRWSGPARPEPGTPRVPAGGLLRGKNAR